MTTSAARPGGPRRDGLVRALDTVRSLARAQAEDVLGYLPDTGDPATGRAVDDFVEQAADALRALDEVLTQTLRPLGADPSGPGAGPSGPGVEPTPVRDGRTDPGAGPWWGDRR